MAPSNDAHGNTPQDADVLARVVDRMIDNGRAGDTCLAVVGQTFEGDRPQEAPICGAVVGPISKPPNIYGKNGSNITAAIDNRIVKKHKKFTLNGGGHERIKKVVDRMIGNDTRYAVFSKKRISEFAEKSLRFEALASKKWSGARLEEALKSLNEVAEPEYQCKGDIKLEPMPEGKAPRLLVADGDHDK